MDTNIIVKEYREGALMHGVGTNSGDHKKANEGYSKLNAAYKIIKSEDPELNSLKELLNDEDSSVKSWAAAHLLLVDPKIAEPVLEEIAKEKGLVAFSAEMTLEQWRNNKLKF